jgi:hypothetical protein
VILFVIELLIYLPCIVLIPAAATMGHARPGDFDGYPTTIVLGVIGTICIVIGLRKSLSPIAAYVFRFVGLSLQAYAILFLFKNKLYLPTNWTEWSFDLFCIISGFYVLAAVDAWITQRIIRQQN